MCVFMCVRGVHKYMERSEDSLSYTLETVLVFEAEFLTGLSFAK